MRCRPIWQKYSCGKVIKKAVPGDNRNVLRLTWERVGHGLGWVIFLGLVFGPLLALGFELDRYLGSSPNDWVKLLIPSGRRLSLLVRSLGLAAGVSLGGMILGTLIASVLWRYRTGTGSRLRWLPLILAPIPPYIHALAWTSTVHKINVWLEMYGLPQILLEGWWGSWWVQVMALLPVAVGLALVALEMVEPMLIESARILRSDLEVLTRIVLPLASPVLFAGGGFLFLITLTDYSVPSLFSVNVYPLEIFAEYSASAEPGRALLLALPLLVIAVSVVFLLQSPLRNAALKPSRLKTLEISAMVFPHWLTWLQRGALVLFVLQVIVPLVSLFTAAGPWSKLNLTSAASSREIFYSFWVALLASLLCLPPALSVARELLRKDNRGRLAWLLATMPLAVPAPLIGIGLIGVWNHPFFNSFYSGGGMPILAAVSRFTPLAAMILLAQLRRSDPLLIDAARVHQTSLTQTWAQVSLPLMAPGLLAAAGLTFALTAGELGATLIIAPPGLGTLTMRIYNYLHYGSTDQVAGLCLVMVLAAASAGCLTALGMMGWSRIIFWRGKLSGSGEV